ncbi:MAG: phospholipid carrier-dependent glycosyltransferase [Burkholderiales bacterium]
MPRILRIDLWIWVCVAAVLLAARLYPAFVPELGHDSFQYLSAADNALAGHIGYTSLIHYDVERSFGVLPAPMLTFPSGYPLVIAVVSLVGVSTKTAALIVSAVSTVACIPLLLWLGARLGFSRVIRHVVVACFVINGIVCQYSAAALSEPLFMLLALAGIAAIVAARLHENTGSLRHWVLAGLAFGATYFVRYAGLFFIVGLTLMTLRHLLARERLLTRGYAIALAVAFAFVTTGIARNMLLVGNWRGRDEMLVSNPLWSVLAQTAMTINGLFLGVGTGRSALGGTFVPKAVLAALLVAGIASLAWGRWRARSTAFDPPPVSGMGIDLLLLSSTYVACMIYAGHTSSISYGAARHFLPLVPPILLLFGLLLRFLLPDVERSVIPRRLPIAALAISFCCYAYLNILVIRKPLENQEALVAEQFSAGAGGAAASRAAVLRLTGPQGAILANNGQAVGYFLGRPTISTVGPEFSPVVWDEQTVRDTLRRFDIKAVVITVPAPGRPDNGDVPSPFIERLTQGKAPAWLTLVDRSATVLTYAPLPFDPK